MSRVEPANFTLKSQADNCLVASVNEEFPITEKSIFEPFTGANLHRPHDQALYLNASASTGTGKSLNIAAISYLAWTNPAVNVRQAFRALYKVRGQ